MMQPEFDSEFILFLESINNKYGFQIKERLRTETKKMQDSKDSLLNDFIAVLKEAYKMEKQLAAKDQEIIFLKSQLDLANGKIKGMQDGLNIIDGREQEINKLKQMLAIRNTDLRNAIDENSKLKENCDAFEKSLGTCKIVFEQHNFDTESGLVGEALSVLEKYKGKG